MRTEFTELVGCSAPIQLAAMPGIADVNLAAAVADAGALGMIGAALLGAQALERTLEELRARTRGAFGVGFLMPFLDRECVPVAARGARVVEFFYGDPERELVALAHEGGALAGWQIGSVDEAVAAEAAGCDYVCAQGIEAGGHVRGRLGRLELLHGVVGTLGVPVVAAGGIATAEDVAEALAAGAAGVRLGTRFVAADESAAHPRYIEALLAAGANDTVLTEAYSVMWPNAPHRVLRSCIERAHSLAGPIVGETPWGDDMLPIERFSVVAPTRETVGAIEAMALYAGRSVAAIAQRRPAGEIVAELVHGAAALLAIES